MTTSDSFYITKHKILSRGDGMVDTQFGDYPLADKTIEIEFREITIEDADPDYNYKTGGVVGLNFRNFSFEFPVANKKNKEDDIHEELLSADEPVLVRIVDILDANELKDGVIKLKVEGSHEFTL